MASLGDHMTKLMSMSTQVKIFKFLTSLGDIMTKLMSTLTQVKILSLVTSLGDHKQDKANLNVNTGENTIISGQA